jgi:flagellar hook-length control protein FliK
MNINQFSDIPSISSQQELNDRKQSIIDEVFFQQLLQFDEKQKELSNNEKFVNLNTFEDQLHQKEESDSDELFTLFAQPLNLQEQPIIATTHKHNTEQLGKNQPALKTNTSTNDLLLDTTHSDEGKKSINVDEKAAEILTSINNSEQLIAYANKQSNVNLRATENNQHSISKKISFIEMPKADQTLPDNSFISSQNSTHFGDLQQTGNNIDNPNQEVTWLTAVNGRSPLSTPQVESQTKFDINLPTPMDITEWQTALNEKISLICRQGIQNAEMKLHPEEWGSLHIKLAMFEDKMNMHMVVAHDMVKSVLESALPQLKVSLEEQGITLQQADISNFSMMDDSKHSSPYQQEQHVASKQLLDEENQTQQEHHHLSNTAQSRLSIFA